ncbi:MAG: carbohydrate kinase [Geminicoccaceae bacterium]|nr:carbohydrate kinase [Geminicoccaceae bacterium]MCB9944315.1 carbohydrate kinase [Geminicoccaceae bacterium]
MTADIIIGIDAGTSVIKAVAFDLEGRQLAMTARPNHYTEPGGGAVEQDMTRTWSDAAAVLREMGERIDGLPQRVAAIGITGQGDGTWLVDADGEPVSPAWLWLDSRSASIVEELERSGVRRSMYAYTGCGLNACNQSAHLLWLQRHAPQLLERTRTAMHCKDWIYFRMTGRRVTDSAEGTFTFGDFRTRAYEPEILKALGIGHLARLLPEMIDGSRTCHPLSVEAAAATGLREGTPVSLGFLDVICTGLGGGLYAPGKDVGCSIIGTTSMHMRLVDHPDKVVLDAEPSGYTMTFPVEDHLTRMQSNMAATINIDWITDRIREGAALLGTAVSRREALAALDPKVLDARPAAALYHPYIHEAGERGPFVDVNARAQFMGLSTRVTTMDLMRSVYEGLSLAGRDCYEAMGEIPQEVRITGGAARSLALKTIFASVLDRPVRVIEREEAGAAGTAMMAAVAIGAYGDMASCARQWVEPLIGSMVEPDPQLGEIYDRQFEIYVSARKATQPIWRQLNS